jgi:hypothetical protein
MKRQRWVTSHSSNEYPTLQKIGYMDKKHPYPSIKQREEAVKTHSSYDLNESEFNNVYKNMSKSSQDQLMSKAFFGVKGNVHQSTKDDYQRELLAFRKYKNR